MNKLKIGIPKGNLQVATIELFKKAGFAIRGSERSLRPIVDDEEIECLLIRAQEIPRYVEQGILDVGLSGEDWIQETGVAVVKICALNYSKTGPGKMKLVIAVPEDSPIATVSDLQGKRIATELVSVTQNYLKQNNVQAEVEFSWGATEVKVPDLADAIAELSETGSSLRANHLKVIATILESETVFMANKQSFTDMWKKRKIENIALLLTGALRAELSVGLKMNVLKKNLDAVVALLPALNEPTVSELYGGESVALEIIVDEKIVRDLIPKLKEVGAAGIVEYPLNKIIL